MRSMGCAGRKIHEERLIRHKRFLLADPLDGLVGEIFHEVVALIGGPIHLYRPRAFEEGRIPLVRLTADEAIEIFEAATARRPCVERADRTRLPNRYLVALAELCRRISVKLQGHRKRCHRIRAYRTISGSARGMLSDGAHPRGMVIAPSQKCLTGGGAQRRCMKAVVLQTLRSKLFGHRRVTWAAKRA